MSKLSFCDIVNRLSKTYKPMLSETDTQMCFVEPILQLLGWDMTNANQARRTANSFDILLYGNLSINKTPSVAVEVKSLTSFLYTLPGQRENGKLVYIGGKWEQPRNDKGVPNADGLAQVRRYCVNKDSGFEPAQTIPVFTNGNMWMVFNASIFVQTPGVPVPNDDQYLSLPPKSITDEETFSALKCLIGRDEVISAQRA